MIEITILGRMRSINVRKALWTADELGVAITRKEYGGEENPTNTPEFLAMNPNGLVPVLRHGDYVLWESQAICRYLCRVAKDPSKLLPTEPRAQGLVDQWLDWAQTSYNAAWYYAFMALVRGRAGYDNRDLTAQSIEQWNRTTLLLDTHLADGRSFITGDDFTLADIVLALMINRWRLSPIDHADAPHAIAYHERLSAREAGKRYCDGIV